MDLRAVLRRSPFYSPYVKAKYRSRSSAREELFTGYFKDNIWGEAESRSGSGSTMANTEAIREWLPILVSGLG
ncbi:MAG TPA: hypothetical protein VEJ84_17905, partial [Acidimicrobiales bacterium]|nr:hypothetical protein [Acidimicrobiales bacterium]